MAIPYATNPYPHYVPAELHFVNRKSNCSENSWELRLRMILFAILKDFWGPLCRESANRALLIVF